MSKIESEIDKIVMKGVTYVPESTILPKPQFEGEYKIVVLQRGWIYVGKMERIGNDCKLRNAACIRQWGTTKGLPELVEGPTTKTVLDKSLGTISFDWLTVVHTIDINPKKWAQLE